jgi:energy-converting hydrogenase Eha subunit F
MNDQGGVDLYKYGKLVAQVESMEKKIDKLESNMEELLELANKSKGGFWMGMVIASGIGGIVTYITSHWTVK